MSILKPGISCGQDTLICDNGGFEQDFLYYFGELTQIEKGSNECTPLKRVVNPPGYVPATWTIEPLPSFRRFEIVNSGSDPLIGISRTKFGNKALLLNHRYGLNGDGCLMEHNREVTKIVKRFKVTSTNREFAIWYAAILENPTDHDNSQPYFGIKCNLAPNSDLCFNASILNCEKFYHDDTCTFTSIDTIPWVCHKVKIPISEIGNIATLEITASDCGCGAHFGYAYIDGICEECNNNPFGSGTLFDTPIGQAGLGIDYYSCDGNMIKVCGSFVPPVVCGNWTLDHINVPGFIINNVSINNIDYKFCFDLPISNFSSISCRELFVNLFFKSGNNFLPQVATNSIEICDSEYLDYGLTAITGQCQNNGTITNMSDDYYYVRFTIDNTHGFNWTAERSLVNPIGTESGTYSLGTFYSSGTYDLGPFLIQEGDWTLKVTIGNCIKTFNIASPGFCSACPSLNQTKITNIVCDPEDQFDPYDDIWFFTISIPGDPNLIYTVKDVLNNYIHTCHFGGNYVIDGRLISEGCKKFIIEDPIGCQQVIYVCPPKPCDLGLECNFEMYKNYVYCNQSGSAFFFDLVVKNGVSGMCFRAVSAITQNEVGSGTYSNSTQGPYGEDIFYTLMICPNTICPCTNPICYKTIYIPKPDCANLGYRLNHNKPENNETTELEIIPNPVVENSFTISTNSTNIQFNILNLAGREIDGGIIKSNRYVVSRQIPAGVYIVRYVDQSGITKQKKFIKL